MNDEKICIECSGRGYIHTAYTEDIACADRTVSKPDVDSCSECGGCGYMPHDVLGIF